MEALSAAPQRPVSIAAAARRASLRRRLARAGPWLLAGHALLSVVLPGCVPTGSFASRSPVEGVHVDGASAQPAAQPAAADTPVANVAPPAIAVPAALAAPLQPAPVALAQAKQRLLDGDYRRATDELGMVAAAYPGTPEAAEAVLRQGEAALDDGQYDVAEDTLRRFLAANPESPLRPTALLLLGRALEGKGDGGGAIAIYKQYQASVPPALSLADVLGLRAAKIYFDAGRIADAWAELSAAVAAAEQSGSQTSLARAYDTLGARYLEAGNRAQAAAAWQAELDTMVAAHRAPRDLAELASRLAGVYQTMGRRDLATQLRWRIIGEWPQTPQALQAMNDLGADSLPASIRGQIAFANRRWQQAADAYRFYLDAGAPEGNADEASYGWAVSLARLGDNRAIDALDAVAATYPSSPWAPEALWEAGNALLRAGDKSAAAARFERLAVGYPASAHQSQALYWLGTLLTQLGNAGAGRRYLEAAAATGNEDYYTFRARAALKRPSPAPKPLDDQETITNDDRAGWDQWLAAHGHSPEELVARRAQLQADPRFQRGMALLDGGFTNDAEAELRELLDASGNDPLAVEWVAVQVRERGFYSFSMTLGHRLWDQLAAMGEPSLLAAPRVVQKLVLPLAFLKLVQPAAQVYHVDPLLLLGLMKQESWFQPKAASSASARGLTQFIYETAKTVADEMQWPNWTWDDMNKPYVSVPFGAYYLSQLISSFRGNYFFALAGYNGGPGNVLRWARGDWNRDIDQFVEEIGFAETRNYVKAVSGNYELYKAVYYG